MPADRRDGLDRRAEGDPVTLGEVYRLLQTVGTNVSEIGEKVDRHETDIALLKDRSGVLRTISLGGILAIWSTFLAWWQTK